MVVLLVVMVPAAALGTPTQQQFQYQNPTLGVSIQYPSDWELLEKSNDKLTFTKQEGFVGADLNVEGIDQSDATLPEYAITRINELRTQRPDFQLLSFEPIIISNSIPAQKVVYTFEREEDGKTNKVMRIWSINEGKLYTLAYIAESSQYDGYLSSFQRMVDSFSIDNTTIQVESGDRSREDNDGNGNCDRTSYPDPDVCIPPYPPDLNCEDVPYKNFEVTGSDPHGFDRDNDGIGCESANGGPPEPTPPKINNTKPPVKCSKYEELIDGKCEPINCKHVEGPGGCNCLLYGKCDILGPDPLPICTDDLPIDQPCRDEGDYDDCEEGFRDIGNGCQPIVGEGPEPEVCTPDGPPCPPCPEGVEAGWCADEDERQDFDCGDPGMENDPRCKDGEPVNGPEEEMEPDVIEEEKGTDENTNDNEESENQIEEVEESEDETEEVSTEEE